MNTLDAIGDIIFMVAQVMIYIIFARVILSWLIAFNVINMQSEIVRTIVHTLDRVTEPLMRPVRRFLPDMGGIDLSPIVVLIGLWGIQMLSQSIPADLAGL